MAELGLTVGALRKALKGVPEDARVVVQDDDGHWSPTDAEHLPIGGPNGQLVLSAECVACVHSRWRMQPDGSTKCLDCGVTENDEDASS